MHYVTFTLLAIGGLNWLVYGLAGWDIVGRLLGGMDSTASSVVYILVGLSAVYEIVRHMKHCKMCEGKGGMQQM